MTQDNNNGNYYRVTIPPSAVAAFDAVTEAEITERTETINALIEQGETAAAIEYSSDLILHVGSKEAAHLAKQMNPRAGDLDASLEVLEALAGRMSSTIEIVERTSDAIDFRADPDPLRSIDCIELPNDLVAEQCGHPVLADIAAEAAPGLVLEPHPTLGDGYYRLRRA